MADRYVYRAQFQFGHGPQARIFLIDFECDLASTAGIGERLASDGVVCGSKLLTVDDGRGGRMIRERRDFAFGAAGLVFVEPLLKPCWEPEE
jgi:hypothetical protein